MTKQSFGELRILETIFSENFGYKEPHFRGKLENQIFRENWI